MKKELTERSVKNINLFKAYKHTESGKICAIQCLDKYYDRVYVKLGPNNTCFTYKQFRVAFKEII